jgi:hypothetical protein
VSAFKDSGGVYNPESEGSNLPIGYIVTGAAIEIASSTTAYTFVSLGSFSDFDPEIPSQAMDYKVCVVYDTGAKSIAERYQTKPGEPEGTGISLTANTATTVEADTDYDKAARTFDGYVLVGYKIEGMQGGTAEREYTFDFETSGLASDASQQEGTFFDVHIAAAHLTDNVIVTWYYEAGTGGIPNSEAVTLFVYWQGEYADKKPASVKETVTKRTRQGESITVTNDGSTDGAPGEIVDAGDGAAWIFDDSRPNSAGGNEIRIISAPATNSNIIFYYNYASNGGETPDKDRYVKEQYRLYEDYDNENPIKGDTVTRPHS